MKLIQNLYASLKKNHWLALLPVLVVLLVTNPIETLPTVVTGNFDRDQTVIEGHYLNNNYFADFINSVSNEPSIGIAGVYVDAEFAYKVVHQPTGKPNYVSVQPRVVTEFALAEKSGSTGLLAHNNLAGKNFSRLTADQRIYLVYGNKLIEVYQVDTIEHYQALSPTSPYSDFIDVDHPAQRITSTELFDHIYARPGSLILQTCIAKKGNPSWGRLFITAHQVTDANVYADSGEKMFNRFLRSERFQ